MSVHPSPVASRFYEKTHQMEMLDMVRPSEEEVSSLISSLSPSTPQDTSSSSRTSCSAREASASMCGCVSGRVFSR